MNDARWNNLGQAREAYVAGLTRPGCLPHEAFLEVSARCNLRCRMCAIAHDTRYKTDSGRPAMLEPTTFRRLRGLFPNLLKAYLYGLGEPTLNRHLVDYISELTDAGVEAWFTTNATLIDREYAHRVARAGAQRVSVSLDGITPETYESIRIGGRFKDAIRGLSALCEARQRFGNPMVTVNFVAMGSNLGELPDLVDTVIGMGVEEINVEPLFAWDTAGPLDRHYSQESLNAIDETWAREVIERAADRSAAAGVHFSSYLVATDGSMDYPRRVAVRNQVRPRCGEPWGTVFVTTAGEIRTCCLNDRVFGLIDDRTVEETWRGDEFAEFRQHHVSGKPPADCEICMTNGRSKISPHLDAVKAVIHRPFSLEPEPKAVEGWSLIEPPNGQTTSDPLTIKGYTPLSTAGPVPEIAIDDIRVGDVRSGTIKHGVFTLELKVPYLTEGVHMLSLVRGTNGAPGWSRRVFRHRRL